MGLLWACPFDTSLREYLTGAFWLPFAKRAASFEKPHVRRMDAPFAGMTATDGDTPMARLRAAYQTIAQPVFEGAAFDIERLHQLVAAARADPSLTSEQREEVALIDAKIDMRAAELDDEDQVLLGVKKKLATFLRTARTPEFRSEARGWLARVDYLLGDQTAAGKIYLDELNRSGSNLSRETLLNSLRMNYGYDGGQELIEHLEDYFDTPEHAAFAIQLVTNPRWPENERDRLWGEKHRYRRGRNEEYYPRIKKLLAKHGDLFERHAGAGALAMLVMRTALSMGDPPGARDIGEAIPADASVRGEPDFNWMLASARFLSHDYAAAAEPLLALFRSARSSIDQKAAAAYGLCGVYREIGNVQEQLRFALWLRTAAEADAMWAKAPAGLADLSIYWASSGWDLSLLLDAEAPIDALASFVNRNSELAGIRLVQYSLAVRLARESRYQEAADLYESIHAARRASRMRKLADLNQAINQAGAGGPRIEEAKYNLAEFLSANPERLYFNDEIWRGYQRYAFQASSDSRLTRAERQALMGIERELKDDQEERWRAYLILRDIVQGAGDAALKRKAAELGVRCLLGINERFGRQEEIRKAEIDLSRGLLHAL
jgi:hypothetical protein